MNKYIKQIKSNYRLVLVVTIVALIIGVLIGKSTNNPINSSTHQHNNESTHQHNNESTHQHTNASANQPEVWTCSMHPQIKMDKPGKCPICSMDLIPLTSMESSDDEVNPNAIVMTDAAASLANIQTMVVSRGAPEKPVFLQGKIHADERNIAELTARFGGRIEKLFVNYTGQKVRKGEKLATLYSPGLVTAQRELIEAIAFKESRPALYKASRAKLRLWDLTEEQIDAIEQKGEPQVYFDVLSPITGTVTMRHVALGDYVKEGSALFQVIDLTSVWGMFDAYESDLPWIKLGDQVEFTVQALPGKNFKAKISYIDPFINAKTRVAKVRVNIANPKGQLKPEMFLNGNVQSKKATNGDYIMIPKSSILWTGKRAVVYVKLPESKNPSFLYREVVLGPEAGSFYVISEGLEEGEVIAVNGVFKIDAAAQLQGLPSMMNPEGGAGSTPHDMSKMNMGGSKASSGKEKMKMSVDKTQVPTEFKEQLTAVFSVYLEMKDAFIKSEAHPVMMAAQKVNEVLAKVDMGLLKGDDHMVWMEQLKTLDATSSKMAKLMDIEKQRSQFAQFNLAFYKALKAFGLNNKTAYYQYCPMAEKDKGAYWFSNSEEIKNPYFGDMMLGCGENREKVK